MPDKVITVEEQITSAKKLIIGQPGQKADPILSMLMYMIHMSTIDSLCACLEELGICGCTEDEDCDEWEGGGEVCFKGQCGCFDADACEKQTKFDGTKAVCEH